MAASERRTQFFEEENVPCIGNVLPTTVLLTVPFCARLKYRNKKMKAFKINSSQCLKCLYYGHFCVRLTISFLSFMAIISFLNLCGLSRFLSSRCRNQFDFEARRFSQSRFEESNAVFDTNDN